jgi:hypothetical protein
MAGFGISGSATTVLADNYGRKFGGKYGTAMTQIDR